MLNRQTRLIDPWDCLFTQIFKRSFQHDCAKSPTVLRKGYNIRKENDIHTAEYYFENGKLLAFFFCNQWNESRSNDNVIGLRKVKPYNFYFRAYAKTRMYGSTILDIFLKEYRGRSEGYYVSRDKKGRIINTRKEINL